MRPEAVAAQVGLGAAAFASTNVDGFVLLVALYSRRDLRAGDITLGQFTGLGLLVFASLVAAVGVLAAPGRWTAWLGLGPLALALRTLAAPASGATSDATFGAPSAVDDAGAAGRPQPAQVLTVALLSVAIGGDNLAVYIPLFAASRAEIPLYVTVFAVMAGLWCWIARRLAFRAAACRRIAAYGRMLLPIVLTALGCRILANALR
jgi:cadmium resistance protein CadD (predicted permease)